MFKTFNMGWGFGIIVDRVDLDEAMNILGRIGVAAEVIGEITDKPSVEVLHNGKRLFLT